MRNVVANVPNRSRTKRLRDCYVCFEEFRVGRLETSWAAKGELKSELRYAELRRAVDDPVFGQIPFCNYVL